MQKGEGEPRTDGMGKDVGEGVLLRPDVESLKCFATDSGPDCLGSGKPWKVSGNGGHGIRILLQKKGLSDSVRRN